MRVSQARIVEGTRMTETPRKLTRKITDDPYGAAILIRRLITEQGLAYWRRYLLAFVLMGVAAAATPGSACVPCALIYPAHVRKNSSGIAMLSGVMGPLLYIKGCATYRPTAG